MQVTTPAGPGDMVSARDFFMIYKAEKRGDTWMQGGCSIEYPDGPKTDKKNVRAWNYPGMAIPVMEFQAKGCKIR